MCSAMGRQVTFRGFFFFLSVMVEGFSYPQALFREECTDQLTMAPGRCRLVSKCSSAEADLRNKQKPTLCSFQGRDAIVCCLDPADPADSASAPQPRPGIAQHQQQTISQMKCAQFYPAPTTTLRPPGTFGIAAIGGEDSHLDEFPHMVALGWRKTHGEVTFKCGGSLISERWVLTAGHCTFAARDPALEEPVPALVRLGVVDIDGDDADRQPLDVPIERIVRHPSYKPPSKYFDIALVKLSQAVPLSDRIKPACLWAESSFDSHTTAIVTGWGTTVNHGQENSKTLQKVEVDILTTDTCQPLLESSFNRHWSGFQDHQLCAGVLEGGRDACQGDSGGPLQIMEDQYPRKYYAIIGVTSFGDQCALKNKPGVYTRTSHFIDWIEAVVWPIH